MVQKASRQKEMKFKFLNDWLFLYLSKLFRLFNMSNYLKCKQTFTNHLRLSIGFLLVGLYGSFTLE